MASNPKNSKYEIKQWLNKIYLWMKNTGRTEYTHNDLPEHLQNPSYHLSAARSCMIQDTGKVIIRKTTYHKVWKLKMRFVDEWKKDEARRLYNMGKSPQTISRIVYMSPNTIRRDIVGVEA